MKEPEKKVCERFLKTKAILNRVELSTGAVNRDTGAAIGKYFYLKMVISDFGNRHRISTFHRLKFPNGAKKK